jgi:hypothetical protein
MFGFDEVVCGSLLTLFLGNVRLFVFRVVEH